MKAPKGMRIALAVGLVSSLLMILMLWFRLTSATEARGALSYADSQTDAPHQSTAVISGTYAGTVAIAEPIALGTLDLAFTIRDVGGALTGLVDVTRTLVFSGAPVLHGSMTGFTNGITPTFSIASDPFTNVVSGRRVQRTITLTGEVLKYGEILQGSYSETLTGFTPKPLMVHGIFLVTRPPLACGSFTVQDLQAATVRWRKQPGDADYDSAYDRNNDGIIDILDIVTVATSVNRSCP